MEAQQGENEAWMNLDEGDVPAAAPIDSIGVHAARLVDQVHTDGRRQ